MSFVVENSYSDSDWTWVGQDRNGLLASFTTAGEGPAPGSLFNVAKREEIFSIEDEILKLPEITSAVLNPKVNYPNVGSYLKLSQRGFFSFDWSDVHKQTIDKKHTYELISKPSNPLLYSSLSADELKLLFVINLSGADFILCDIDCIRA